MDSSVLAEIDAAFREGRDAIIDAKHIFNEELKETEEELGVDLPTEPLKAARKKAKKQKPEQ